MYKVVTPQVMRDYEYFAINTIGIPEAVLMENAGAAVESAVIKRLDQIDKKKDGKVAVVCGKGNNGGDGLVAARRLKHKGIDVDIFYTAPKMKKDAYDMLEMAGRMGVAAYKCELMPDYTFDRYDIIVDGIFGLGLTHAPERVEKRTIEIINKSKKYVIAIDIPSGVSSENGKILSTAVKADETVTFAALKTGHVLLDGRDMCGKITVADIGVKVDKNKGARVYETEDVKLPERKINSHKGDYGRLKIIAGSGNMPGAAVLTAQSALKSGAGLVTMVVPDSLKQVYQQRVTEATLHIMPDVNGYMHFTPESIEEIMKFTGGIVIGNGLGNNPEVLECLRYILGHYTVPVVIDADALNLLAGNLDMLLDTTCKVILTPHLKEFGRLLATDDLEKIELNMLNEAEKFAKRYECTLLLKGATSIITDGENTVFNMTGTPALAKGGSGDVLAGLIGALMMRLKPLTAAAYGAYIFGRAGEAAAKEYGLHGLLASEVIGKFKDFF